MNLEQKRNTVAKLRDDFDRSQSVVFLGYGGLGAGVLNKLRGGILEAGGKFQVAKNTLIVKAFESEKKLGELTGPTAVVFAFTDPLAPLRALREFGKELGALELKGGVFEGVAVSSAEVVELSEIPGRDILLAQLGSLFQAPLRSLMAIASSPVQRFVSAVDGLSNLRSAS